MTARVVRRRTQWRQRHCRRHLSPCLLSFSPRSTFHADLQFPPLASPTPQRRSPIPSTLHRMFYQSESALKCKERFLKNRDKLFTFLDFDGVPWNNNNAEHAIKAYATLRKVMQGLSTRVGTEDYLILLSVCQTCKYQGLDFLDFLRSGEKDIEVFAQANRRKGRSRQSQSANGATLSSEAGD
jgi:hypothetical protein